MNIDNELEALKLLKDWSIWLVSTQTVILGIITVFTENNKLTLNSWSMTTVFSFILSILVATWILGAIPSIAQDLSPGMKIHHMELFEWLPIKLWAASAIQHILFVIGICSLGGYILFTPPISKQDGQKHVFETEFKARLLSSPNALTGRNQNKEQ